MENQTIVSYYSQSFLDKDAKMEMDWARSARKWQ